MTLEAELLSFGCHAAHAATLSKEFSQEPPSEFLAGLTVVTESVNSGQKPGKLPAAEPWRTIHGHIVANGVTPEQAFENAIKLWAPAVQIALQGLVGVATLKQPAPAPAAAAPRRKRYKIADYLGALGQLGYSFKMNDLNDTIEVSGKPITDELASEIRARMREKGFEFVNVMEDIYRMEASHHRYNPIHDYLNGLQWDGQAHIATLAGHFVDRYGVFSVWLRRWLIGAVAKAKANAQNMVLVLDGPQGIGKSEFARWLCSGIGRHMYCEQALNLDDKDSYIRLASYFVWELAEFGQTIRKVDRELFKNFITQSTISVRRAYGRYDMVKPAMASLMGTVNDEVGVLDDPTGSRRFMVTHLDKINWAYSQVDVNQVWAEAQAAYLAGEPWQLAGDERDKAQTINAMYEVEDPLEGILLRYFRVDPALPTWTSSQEILEKLENNGLKGTSRQNSMALAVVMKRLKCERVKQNNVHTQRVWGYRGVSVI